MKIFVSQIPPEGLIFTEEIPAEKLEADSEIASFRGPIRLKAFVSKITNAVTVDLDIAAELVLVCGRCIAEFDAGFKKRLRLNYPVDKSIQSIDLDPEIRQEIILSYPVNPLCKADCKGLCIRCGKNLNDGRCACPHD